MADVPETRAIFGFPYAGSLYHLLSRENPNFPPMKGHSYYDSLYGVDPGRYAVATTNLAILYDNVILPPADDYLPDFSDTSDGFLKNVELGISVSKDWEAWSEAFDIAREIVDRHLIRQMLQDSSLPNQGYEAEHILAQAIQFLRLSIAFDAALVVGDRVSSFMSRIFPFVQQEISDKAAMSSAAPSVEVSERRLRVLALDWEAEDLGQYSRVRQDPEVREYARGMQAAFARAAVAANPDDEFKKIVQEARHRAGVAKKCKGVFETVGTLSSISGAVVPIATASATPINDIASIGSLGSVLLGNKAQRTEHSYNWFRLGSQIRDAAVDDWSNEKSE